MTFKTTSKDYSSNRIDSIQTLRSIAFLVIFLYHSTKKVPGAWGVSVFFVLSGFVMVYSYWNRPPEKTIKKAAQFSWNKIKRLYPLHLIMLMVAFFRLLIQKKSVFSLVKQLTLSVFLVQTWTPFHYQAINSVAWYLSVCVVLYFLFPFLFSHIRKDKALKWVVLEMFLAFILQLGIGFVASRFSFVNIKWLTYCFPLFRVGDFFVGGNLAYLYQTNKHKNTETAGFGNASILEIVVLICNVAVCVFYLNAPKSINWAIYTSLFLPFTALLVYCFALNKGGVSKTLTNQFVLWIAGLSPYAFLIHREVIYWVEDAYSLVFQKGDMNKLLLTLVAFIITIIMASLYMKLKEILSQRKISSRKIK